MSRTISGFFWIALYLLVVLLPVGLMLVPPVPSGRGFWLEFSVALGFVALTQIAVQFVLIARFKRVTAPYGIDVILRYHRQIALVAVGLVLLHPIIIVIDNPSRAKLLNPLGGNWASRSAWGAIFSLIAIVVTSVFRERLRLNYEMWRLSHLVLGVAAVVFAQLHVSMAGLYTNTFWKHAVWIGIAVITVGLVLYLRVWKPVRQKEYTWRIAAITPERGDTNVLTLEPVGQDGMTFEPGQFAWIKLEGTPFTLEEHPFSFAGSAEKPGRIEFGVKALGDFTKRLKDIAPGTLAYVDGPHGAFSIDRYPAVGYVFIAGGVGITPFVSMLRTMADREDPRPVMLIYADKSLDDAAYHDEIERLKERLQLEVRYVLESPPDHIEVDTGQITSELLERHIPKERFTRAFFVCGPPAMMAAVHKSLIGHDVPERHIHMERFDLA
ncbi:MAG TPA: ferric reductase-like transmembrane domain-containing protein [Tepidisphaeraceae bacterium]|jgi:predicted ferric reductase|nr:ferric reductase-like transmembrane domain-containing protein [Tepidisphaeraceae bacterium]